MGKLFHKIFKMAPKKNPKEPKEDKKEEKASQGEGRGSALKKAYALSDDLADLVGFKEGTRQEVTKFLFAYIKENNLKDPENGHFFFPDKKMSKIFGKDRMRAFSMQKNISEHLTSL